MSTVLIIEDSDRDIRKCMQVLKKTGFDDHDMIAVSGTEHGLAYLDDIVEGAKPVPSLIVLDLLLGNNSGFELLRSWKASAKLKRIPVIVWTAVEGKIETEMCTMFGVSARVGKSEGDIALKKAIQQILPGKTASSPHARHQ